MNRIIRRFGYLLMALTMVLSMWMPSVALATSTSEPVVYYQEDFSFSGEDADYLIPWSGTGSGTGLAVAKKNSASVVPTVDGENTVLSVKATAADGLESVNIIPRWATAESWADSTCYADMTGKSVVYQFNLKPVADAKFNVQVRTIAASTQYTTLFQVKGINRLDAGGTTLNYTLENGKWYTIALVCNFATGKEDVYINGEQVASGLDINNYANLGLEKVNQMMRIINSSADAIDQEFLLDNVAVYEGAELSDDLFEANTPDADEVVVKYKENFYYAGTEADYMINFSGANSSYGIATVLKNAAVATPETQNSNTALYVKTTADDAASSFQIDARYAAAGGAWTDADCIEDVTGKSVVYHFKLKPIADAKFNVQVRTKASSTQLATLFQVKGIDRLDAAGTTLEYTMENGIWYDIALVCDFAAGKEDIYINGVQVADDLDINNYTNLGLDKVNTLLRFVNSSTPAIDQEFLLDDIRVYEATAPVVIAFEQEDTGSGSSGEENPGDTEVNVTEGAKIAEADFEMSNPLSIAYSHYDNVVEWISEPNATPANKVLHMARRNSANFHADYKGINSDSDSIVYDFDIYLEDVSKTDFIIQLKDANSQYSQVARIQKDGTLKTGGVLMANLTSGKWYNIAVVYNYVARTRTVYVDGELMSGSNELPIEEAFDSGKNVTTMRFLGIILSEDKNVAEYTTDLMLDNIRIYEGTKPCETLIEKEVDIIIDPNKSIFTDTSAFDTQMAGYISVHTRNGMVYQNGSKTKLKTAPVIINGEYAVVVEEICEVLGIPYSAVGDSSATVNEKTATIVTSGGKHWIGIRYFFETILEKTVTQDSNARSAGLMVAGDSTFTFPSSYYDASNVFSARSDLQDFNDYLFFDRPTAAQILEDYNASALQGVHPRIQITSADIAVLKTQIQSNSLKMQWYQQLILAADYLVEENTEALKYELDASGVRLLQVSRDMLDHMYTLGMAYQLTGEQKYVERAWVDLYAVSNFKDWHPEHDLDPAEMCAAVAIGYDWMYDGLTEDQRIVIEQGIYKNGFVDACEAYQSRNGKLGGAVLSTQNHNIVLNGGFAMAGMAFMDVYPAEGSHLVAGGIRAADIMLTEFGPDGAWKEGPGYWEYAMQYTAKMLSSLEKIFGTCYSLDKCEGLNTAANYILALQSDQGAHNYGDGQPTNFYVPEVFYLSNKYNVPSATSTMLTINHGKMMDSENVVLSLIWYDTSISAAGTNMALDNVYQGEGVATFRDSWTDGQTTFVSIHGGKTQICHAQADGGTFVYDYAGIRWAKELGSTPYDTSVSAEYAEDGRRWLLYRSRAEAHNTIVINPDNSAGQKIDSTAYLTRSESKDKGAIAVMDMSELYAENASSAIRGFFFTDDRTSLVIRDEISLTKADSLVYWFMQTEASVEIAEDGQSAILTRAGKQIKLEFVTTGNGTAELSYGPSTRMETSTSPVSSGDTEDAAVNRVQVKLTGASGDVSITVKLTPVGVKSSAVANYNKAISEWTIPDGEIEPAPEVQSVTVDGRTITFDDSNQAQFLCVIGKYTEAPKATATVDTEKYTVQITDTTAIPGTITIIVSDKNDPTIMTQYTIDLVEVPIPTDFEGMTSLQIVGVQVSDTPEPVNHALNAFDNKNTTRWTSQGMGNWMVLEIEEVTTVDNVMILFYGGGADREAYYNVCVSEDGINYEQVFTGKTLVLKGVPAADAYVQIPVGGKNAKFIKIECNGNSAQGMTTGWNAIAEVVITQNGDSEQEIIISGSAIDSKLAAVTAPTEGWKVGENTFTVEADVACVVAVSNDGGKNYTRLTATADDNGGYSFTANLTADSQIAVVVAGDANGDGSVNGLDTIKAKTSMLQSGEVNALELLAADLDGNGAVNGLDLMQLKASILNNTELPW